MDELDKAYETAEMLKSLDLPISKDQIENIERLERESGREQREDLRLYFYEKCFAHYTKRVINIRQAKIRGETIVAKPVFLLAIIDEIGEDMFSENEFRLTKGLEERYVMLMHKYMKNSQFDKPTDISNPFWHLQSDGFWHLEFGEQPQDCTTPSKRWLKKNISVAYFDDDLWMLLQNNFWRQKLRDFIVKNKLTDDGWFGKIAAEGLGAIAALLLVA